MARRRITMTGVAVTLGAGAVLILQAAGAGSLVEPITARIRSGAAPLYAAGVSVRAFFRRDAPLRNSEELRSVIDSMRIENARFKALAAENEALKLALAFSEREASRAVTARVVSASTDDVSHTLLIDRGANDGIREGQPAVAAGGVLIGKIIAVSATSANVLLLTDSKSKVAVAIQNARETIGVLEGDRGLSMAINLIPQTEIISTDDTVITSGMEPGIKRGLVIGTVERVNRGQLDPFQTATVKPFKTATAPVFVQVLTLDARMAQ